jgi:hypothetical protein
MQPLTSLGLTDAVLEYIIIKTVCFEQSFSGTNAKEIFTRLGFDFIL